MALTLTPNLTVFSEAQDNTGGTWAGASGAFDTEVKFMDTASWYYQTPKNAVGNGNFTPSASVDMSATDTHLYWAMKCDVFPFCEVLNTGATASGLMVKVESGTNDYVTWHIAGSDTWGGEWKQFVLDLNNTANKYATVGTLNLAAVTKVSFLTDNSNSGNIRIIDNTNINAVRFGTGVTLTGTLIDLVDAAIEDELPANKYGVLKLIDGNVHCQGRVISGNGATTTTFNSTDEEIVFVDAIVSSTLYQLNFVGSGNTSVVKGLVAKGAGNATFALDASDATADLTMTGSTLIRAGVIDFASTSDIQTTVFNNCGQIDPSTGTFKSNTISNYVGTTGAVLFPTSDTNIATLNFINCDNGVEYDAASDSTSPTFNNFQFDDLGGNFDVNNTSGAAATINLSNTPANGANSYNTGGDTVTFSVSVSLTITGLASNTELTIVKRGTAVDTGSDGATTVGSRDFVTGNTWTVDAYKGHLLEITSGSDLGRYYCSGNSATTLYLDAELSTTASSLTWELYDENDDTEAYHVENTSGNAIYNYTSGAGDKTDVLAVHLNYQDINLPFTLPSTSGTLPLNQIEDVNYFNP